MISMEQYYWLSGFKKIIIRLTSPIERKDLGIYHDFYKCRCRVNIIIN